MSDLEAFFAMKDKKKSKARPHYFAPDELFRNMEDTGKNEGSPRTRKLDHNYSGSSSAPTLNQVEQNAAKAVDESAEDEWREFNDERRKDYTGLKIGQLVLQDQEDDCKDEGGDHVDDYVEPTLVTNGGDGFGDAVSNTQGPWKKITTFELGNKLITAGGPCIGNIDEMSQSDNLPETERTTKKVYVPPALRKSLADISEGNVTKKTSMREAPDLSSDVFFPTLGSAVIRTQKYKKN